MQVASALITLIKLFVAARVHRLRCLANIWSIVAVILEKHDDVTMR